MLCITRHEEMTDISIDGLDHVQVSSFSWTPERRILLSWDLLSWISVEGGIPCSFTNFITTPELSGSMYIRPDIYHTQITEYSLKTIFVRNYSEWALFFLSLSALNIFLIVKILMLDPPHFLALSNEIGALGNTFPELFQLKWFFIYFDQFVRNALYLITLQDWWLIRWRVLSSGFRSVFLVNAAGSRQTPQTKNNAILCIRDLIPSDRATCTIVSRVNFFSTKKALPRLWLSEVLRFWA